MPINIPRLQFRDHEAEASAAFARGQAAFRTGMAMKQQREQDERQQQLMALQERQEALKAYATLADILGTPKASRGPLIKLAGQIFGAKYGMDAETLTQTAAQLDDGTATALADMVRGAGVKVGQGEMDPRALLQFMKPEKALPHLINAAKEAKLKAEKEEKGKIVSEPLPKDPGTAVPEGWQPSSKDDQVAVLQQQEAALMDRMQKIAALSGGGLSDDAQRYFSAALGRIKEARERLSPKPEKLHFAQGPEGTQGLNPFTGVPEGPALPAAPKEASFANDHDRLAGEMYDKPFARLTPAQRGAVNKRVQQERLDLSKAQGLGAAELKLDMPLSVPDAKALQVPVGTTLREVRDQKLVPQTAQQQTTAEALKGTTAILNRLDVLADKVFTAEGLLGRLAKAPSQNLGIMLQTDEEAVLYQSLANGVLANMVRAFGERGTLTDQDIARARALIPKLTPVPDTRVVAKKKLAQLKALIGEIGGRPEAGGAAPSEAPAPSQPKATHRYNPKTGTVEEIK